VLCWFAGADVCWCKGSVAEKIFTPMVERIRSQGGEVLGNKLVTRLVTSQGMGGVEELTAVEALDRESGVCGGVFNVWGCSLRGKHSCDSCDHKPGCACV
jgi:hypothetical protein